MVQYLEVPKTPSILFTSNYNNRQLFRPCVNNFNSNSAPDSRDFASARDLMARRSNSDFGLPRIYEPSTDFITPRFLNKHKSASQIIMGMGMARPLPERKSTSFSALNFSQQCQQQPFPNNNSGNRNKASGINMQSKWRYTIRKERVSTLETLQIFAAEFLGTAMLLLIGCTPSSYTQQWTWGFAFATSMATVGTISGAFINPSVTIAAFIMGKIKHPLLLPVYLAGQFLGAFAGYALHWFVVLAALPGRERMCLTIPSEQLGNTRCLFLEIIMTFAFIISICALFDDRNKYSVENGALKIGIALIGILFSTNDVTAVSLNTARALPPAVFNNDFTGHWIYWIGPNLGGFLAGLVYRFILYPRPWADIQ